MRVESEGYSHDARSTIRKGRNKMTETDSPKSGKIFEKPGEIKTLDDYKANVHTETLRAFNEERYRNIISALP